MEELRAIISGRVQLVMMRDFVQRSARSLGLTGYVKNLSDGTVEVIAQGEKQFLEKLVERLHKGAILSRVDTVHIEWHTPVQRFSTFDIQY